MTAEAAVSKRLGKFENTVPGREVYGPHGGSQYLPPGQEGTARVEEGCDGVDLQEGGEGGPGQLAANIAEPHVIQTLCWMCCRPTHGIAHIQQGAQPLPKGLPYCGRRVRARPHSKPSAQKGQDPRKGQVRGLAERVERVRCDSEPRPRSVDPLQWCRRRLSCQVQDIYNGATSTTVSVTDGLIADIPVQSGIKQGCPLSGLLFIMAIDPVVSLLQGEVTGNRVLAFADDLCLIADSPQELPASIDAAHDGLGRLGPRLNAAKCASLHLSGWRPGHTIYAGWIPLCPLAEGEAATFFRAQVGFNIVPSLSTLVNIIDIGLRIARSMLAPWQRMDALKTFLYPSIIHLNRLGAFPKSDWARVDKIMRPEIKKTYLPQEDIAFKLVTSPDQRFAEDAAEHVEEVAKRRIQPKRCFDRQARSRQSR